MRKIFFSLFILSGSMASFSQSVNTGMNASASDILSRDPGFMTTNPHTYNNVKYLDIASGTPYFKDEWMQGSLVIAGAPKLGGLLLKIDMVEGKVHFFDKGVELEAAGNINEAFMTDSVTGEAYHFVHSSAIINDAVKPDLGWYQVLQEGKAVFYKRYKKELTETKPDYGSSVTHGKIVTDIEYYVLCNNRLQRVKKLNDLFIVFFDKKAEIEDYINKNNIKGKSEADFIRIIAQYNLIAGK
jgi:hypothetical protein